LAYQDEFFENNSLDVKENDEHALDFAFHLSRHFPVRLMIASLNACLITASVTIAPFPRFAQNLLHAAVGSIAKLH
jgi:hypothetical protein